jgi:hypothetical protein
MKSCRICFVTYLTAVRVRSQTAERCPPKARVKPAGAKMRKKEYCTAMACEGCALGFTHTQNSRKHRVSSKHP